jgi:hypothetical protein
MNPIYQQMNNGSNDFLSRFNYFRQSFKGDPQQQVQQLLNSGKVSQEQYNAAVQKAQQLSRILGMK